MSKFIETITIGGRLLYESIFYFIFSYLTIFISIFTIKVVEGGEYINVFFKPEIIAAFLAAIPTYLIGIHYAAEDNRKYMKNILLLIIVVSVALFGIVFNVKTINDMGTVENLTYIMLFISLIFTLALKVDYKEFKNDIATQKKADESREKEEVNLPSGKKLKV